MSKILNSPVQLVLTQNFNEISSMFLDLSVFYME